mgnify:CR=1 FL=1
MDKENLDKLKELLSGNKAGGTMDIVWGEDLRFKEIKPNIAIILGVSGQDGQYLTELLLSKGYHVVGVARRSSQPRKHLDPLIEKGLELVEGDITDPNSMNSLFQKYCPTLAFNLAAMSHVHTSFNSPLSTFEIDTIGVVNILEAIKNHSKHTRLYHASTSELFGSSVSNLAERSPWCEPTCEEYETKFQDEGTPFSPNSPYAIAKLAAHHMVRLYRESYGLFVCSGILFNHSSERRGENFLTRKISKYIGKLQFAINSITHGADLWVKETFPKLKLGNIDSFRDEMHAEDAVRAMVMMLEAKEAKDYVVGSGKTHSGREFCELAFNEIGLDYKDWIEIDPNLFRPAEVDYLCSLPTNIKEELGWEITVPYKELVKRMVNNDIELAKKESV